MSTDSGTTNDPPVGSTITLTYEDDWWVASDEATGHEPRGPTDATDAAAESTADHTNGEPTGATQDTESSPHAATQKTPRPTGHNLLARLSMN